MDKENRKENQRTSLHSISGLNAHQLMLDYLTNFSSSSSRSRRLAKTATRPATMKFIRSNMDAVLGMLNKKIEQTATAINTKKTITNSFSICAYLTKGRQSPPYSIHYC
jgi:hypothetical protein